MTAPQVPDETLHSRLSERTAEIGALLERRGFVPTQRLASLVWERPAPRRCMVVLARESRTRYAGEIRYRKHLGYRLRIDLDCEAYTQLYFVKSGLARNRVLRLIWRWRRLQLVESVPAILEGHVVLAREADWAGSLLLEKDATKAAADLIARHAGSLYGSVYLEPGSLAYASPVLAGDVVEAEYVGEMLDGLETIREACHRLPQPSQPLEPSKWRAFARKKPLAAALSVVGALVGCLFVLGMVGFALLIGLAALLQST